MTRSRRAPAAGLVPLSSGVTLGSPGGGERTWHARLFLSEDRAHQVAVLDADCMGSRPVIHARAGLEVMLPPPSTPSQLKKDQLLRGFERAERVGRRGWELALPADELGCICAGVGASRRLRG